MELVIDGRIMAVSTPSGVPVMDISLVLGDTVPVRIRVDHALTDCTPALAVKETIGSPGLIMTVTGWTREDDWQRASWVVNTLPLQEALGSADSVALVAELVLVSPDGAQHTSRPIRVTVRRDILPAEYAPPAEVLANWEEMVAASLAAQLPDALHKAGMFVTPVDGVTTLTMPAGSNDRDFNFYTFAVNSTYISGHLAAAYKLNKITLRTPAAHNDGTRWRARLYKITNASTMQTEELGESNSTASWVSINSSTAECSWIFNALPIAASDRLVIEIYAVDASGATIDKLFIAYGSAATHGGTEGILIKPEGNLIWRNYTRLLMTLEVAYTEGVSVGGIELADKKHFDALAQDVVTTGEQVHADAQTASTAATTASTSAADAASSATAARQALAAMPQVDAEGNMDVRGMLGVGRRAVFATNQTALIMQHVTNGTPRGLALDWGHSSAPNVCFVMSVGATTGIDYSYLATMALAPDTIKLPSSRTTATGYDMLNRGEMDARYVPLTDVLPAIYRAASLYYSEQYDWTRANILRDFCGEGGLTALPDDMPEPAALAALTDGHNLFRGIKLTRLPASWTFPALTKCNEMFRDSEVVEVTISSPSITSCPTLIYNAHRCERINMDFGNVTSISYMAERANLSEFCHSLGNVTNANNAWMSNPMTEFNSALPKVVYANNMFNWTQLRTCRYPVDADGRSIYESGQPQAVDDDGNGLYAYLTLPQMVAGALAFSGAQLDLPSAMSIIGNLRQSVEGIAGATWLLTIGIHVDHRQDAGLLAAIEAATARGWTITVQYNGTATVATLSEGQPDESGQLWCKAVEDEAGDYVDTAGVRYRVDWGHDISGPSGDAQQLGYTQHATLEAALTQWGLTSQPVDPSTLNS